MGSSATLTLGTVMMITDQDDDVDEKYDDDDVHYRWGAVKQQHR